MSRLTSVEDSGLGSAAPAGDASDSGRAADRDTNAGATPAPTLPRCHTESAPREQVIHCLICGTRWKVGLYSMLWPDCDCDDRGPAPLYRTT